LFSNIFTRAKPKEIWKLHNDASHRGIIFSGKLLTNHHPKTSAKPPSIVCNTLGETKKKETIFSCNLTHQ